MPVGHRLGARSPRRDLTRLHRRSNAEMGSSTRANILVADDVRERLVTMEAVLEELDQNVVTVSSGREALKQVLQNDFAVIMLDVNMPELDGFETASLIRERPRSAHTPIIFVTAFGDDAHAFQGYSLGAVDYILTPVDPEILRAKVRVFVELFQKNEQLKRQADQQAALVALADRRAAQLRMMATELAHTEQRERRRLAQILHDHLQQLLVAARMGVDRIRSHAESAALQEDLALVTDLINQSISASRSLAIELSPPVLNEAGLGPALEWLGRWMREKYGLSVTVDCDCGPQPLAEEMRLTLFQSVRELLFNVVKHSGMEKAAVAICREENDWLRIVVIDEGKGFDVDAARHQSGQGGLGLFSIRERMETLGGRFELQSIPGSGTRVVLSAPLQLSPPPDAVADREPSQTAADAAASLPVDRAKGTIRVLLADDHAILRRGLRGILQSHAEIEVVGEAGDGHEAVARTAALQPDIVVMDINMPRMNGTEATRQIKQSNPAVAVIGLSLHEDKEVVASMMEAGASGYVTKGGPPEELIRAIRAAIAQQPSVSCA